MVVLLFGGPSLEGIDLSGSHITLLPPAVQGDMLRHVRELQPQAVGLLDCELPHRDLPTWHKEIIHTLNLGIPVAGAASVGAHRAAELAPHGMEGVGSIYRRVASGELERDDEVLGDWEQTPEGCRQLSLPLVLMRDVLDEASKAGVLSQEKSGILTKIAEKLFWRHRSWETLFEEAFSQGISEEDRASFTAWLPQASNPVREDALALVKRLEELGNSGKENGKGKAGKGVSEEALLSRERNISSLFKSLNSRDRSVPSSQGTLRQWALADSATFSHPDAEELNRQGLNRRLALLLGTLWKITPPKELLTLEEQRLRRRFGLKSHEALQSWMEENDLDETSFQKLLEEEATLHLLHRWFMQGRIHEKNTGALLEEMKLQGKYKAWKDKTARRERILEEQRELYLEESRKTSSTPFRQLLKEHLRGEKLPWKASLLEILAETGMELTDFMDEIVASRVARIHLNQTLGGTGKKPEESDHVPS